MRRVLFLALAGIFFLLALVGAVLPILPTTPFLLLTSYFLIRSSPRLHRKLLRSRLFGPLIRDWEVHRGVRRRVKVVAVVVMLAVVVLGAASTELSTALLIVLFFLAAVGLFVVLRLPVIREVEHGEGKRPQRRPAVTGRAATCD